MSAKILPLLTLWRFNTAPFISNEKVINFIFGLEHLYQGQQRNNKLSY